LCWNTPAQRLRNSAFCTLPMALRGSASRIAEIWLPGVGPHTVLSCPA